MDQRSPVEEMPAGDIHVRFGLFNMVLQMIRL